MCADPAFLDHAVQCCRVDCSVYQYLVLRKRIWAGLDSFIQSWIVDSRRRLSRRLTKSPIAYAQYHAIGFECLRLPFQSINLSTPMRGLYSHLALVCDSLGYPCPLVIFIVRWSLPTASQHDHAVEANVMRTVAASYLMCWAFYQDNVRVERKDECTNV